MNLVVATEPIRRRWWIGYPIALLACLLATLARLEIAHLLEGSPFLLPVGAVTVVAFVAGIGPGILAAVLLGLVTEYLFLPPYGSLLPANSAGLVAMLFYSLLCATIIALLHAANTAHRAQMRSEAALRALNHTLETHVSDRTAALTREIAERGAAEDQLRQLQKMESLGQLTGGIAHDFNNLLTVILGAVDMLNREGLQEERRVRYVAAIGDTANRAAKLTGQLLAFARRQTLRPVLFDVGESLRGVTGIIESMGSRITLDLQLPPEPFFVEADRSQFDTAIVNIAINARDAMGGEGTLTIRLAAADRIPPLRAHDPIAGDFVTVTLIDTGAGISPDHFSRIFEPFYTSKGIGEGTGLGLSQALGFAKQSGGDIGVASTPGHGAAFTLYLPRAYATVDAAAEGAPKPMVDGDGICVLVVEDNAQVGAFATEALRELGYDSILAADAEAALAELAKDCTRFQIVFSDVMMPGMDGMELGETIERLYPDVPVILTSGYSDVLARDRAGPPFELLHKPYSVEQLSIALRSAIRGATGR